MNSMTHVAGQSLPWYRLGRLQFFALAVCSVLLSSGLFSTAAASADDGFVSVFNGTDFDGWYIKLRKNEPALQQKVFTVEDGMVHVFRDLPDEYGFDSGPDERDTFGMMYTKTSYTNYIFRFEYKWGPKRYNNFHQLQYDAGCYYHVTHDDIWPRGIEYQVRYDNNADRNHTGDLIRGGNTFTWYAENETAPHFLAPADGGQPIVGRTRKLFAKPVEPVRDRNFEWNQCEIIVMGNQYAIHKLNGDVVNLATDLSARSGIIGLQSETAEIFYRNIEIKEFEKPLPLKRFVATGEKERLLYIYGDVSANGQVPSGDERPYDQMRLSDEGRVGMSQFKAALEAAGFEANETYDCDIRFSAESLAEVDVLILGSNQRMFSPEEVAAVKTWVEQGGGLVVWSDSAFGGFYREVGVDNTLGRDSDNLITEQFGMHFLTDCGGGNYLIKEYTEDHFLNRYQKDDGLRFRGEGVSYVRVSPPARILAKAQRGGMKGGLRVNKVDGTFNPKTDAALAVAEIGLGRVVGVFDRNLFWNAGAGTRLSHSDNREFAQRVMLWAAGSEDESRIPKSELSAPKPINNPPTITIKKQMVNGGKRVDLQMIIDDADEDGIIPEVRWSQLSGPGKARFENDNPNLINPRIDLPEKGTYRFEAVTLDGEFKMRDHVTVIRE